MSKIKVAIDDMAKIKKLGSLTLSPSGKKVAFTVTEGSLKDNKYLTDIWVYDESRTPALYRLTAGEDGKAPIFEDENTILFAADRKKRHPSDVFGTKTTYNRISLQGGEAEEAFVLPFAVSMLTHVSGDKWLCGGRRDITKPDVSGMDEAEKAKVKKALEEDKDYEVFDELPFWMNGQGVINKKRTGLFLCDVKEGTQELLTDPYFTVKGLVLSDDKKTLAYWGLRFESKNPQKDQLFLRDMESGKLTEVALGGRFNINHAQFLNGRLLFLGHTGEILPVNETDKFYYAAMDGSFTELAAPDYSMGAVGSDIAGGGSSMKADDGYYFLRTDRYRSKFMKMDPAGAMEVLADDVNIISAAVGKKDDLYFIGMEKDACQELYRKKDGKVTMVSGFNAAYMEEHEIAKVEHFVFNDRDGVDLDGWILKPADFDESRTYPAILTVHGGPVSAFGEGFFHEMQYWAGRGYVVFYCNPRGGAGRGNAFIDIFGEKYCRDDYNDIMDFTDEVLKRVPQIDPARVAMTGGSYGGLIANWIIGHTDRFAAVASCRSIANYYSKILTTDIGYYHNLPQVGADPWSEPETVWAHSPLAYADKVKTPTLFIQSDEDYRCWMGDAVQMLSALLMHGVPARMCLFHGENHELSRSGKPKHRVRRIREITAWFDKYLGVAAEEE